MSLLSLSNEKDVRKALKIFDLYYYSHPRLIVGMTITLLSVPYSTKTADFSLKKKKSMCMCECSYVHVKASSQEVQRNRSPCPQVFSGNWTQILCKNTKSQEFLTAESSIHSQRFLFLMMGGPAFVCRNVPMNADAQGGQIGSQTPWTYNYRRLWTT